MNQLAMRGSMTDRLREAELRELELAIVLAHAEDDGSNVIAIEAIRRIYPSLATTMQLQPDGTYEPTEKAAGTTICGGCNTFPLGHEGECGQ